MCNANEPKDEKLSGETVGTHEQATHEWIKYEMLYKQSKKKQFFS